MGQVGDPLAVEYGETLPPGLAGLTDDQRQFVAAAIDAARVRQARALADATENGLDFIPRLLRGPVRKVLFG